MGFFAISIYYSIRKCYYLCIVINYLTTRYLVNNLFTHYVIVYQIFEPFVYIRRRNDCRS